MQFVRKMTSPNGPFFCFNKVPFFTDFPPSKCRYTLIFSMILSLNRMFRLRMAQTGLRSWSGSLFPICSPFLPSFLGRSPTIVPGSHVSMGHAPRPSKKTTSSFCPDGSFLFLRARRPRLLFSPISRNLARGPSFGLVTDFPPSLSR